MIDYANMTREQVARLRLDHTLAALRDLQMTDEDEVKLRDIGRARDMASEALAHAAAAGIKIEPQTVSYIRDAERANVEEGEEEAVRDVTYAVNAALRFATAGRATPILKPSRHARPKPPPGPKKPKLPSFREKRAELLSGLTAQGWNVHSYGPQGALKLPWAEDPDAMIRLWFKPQAVWYGPPGAPVSEAHSLESDIRSLTVEALVQAAERNKLHALRRGVEYQGGRR